MLLHMVPVSVAVSQRKCVIIWSFSDMIIKKKISRRVGAHYRKAIQTRSVL